MLISRPSAVVIAGTLLALVLVWVIIVTPIGSESPFRHDTALDFWWSRLAPESFARNLLSSTPAFTAFNDLPSCGYAESRERAWYIIASGPDAERRFIAMFTHGGPATRLYAITGLAFLGSPAFRPSLARLIRDTATVRFDNHRGNVDALRDRTYIFVVEERAVKQVPFGPPEHTTPLAALVSEERVRLWAALLASNGSRSCAT
jgi:hypothetical protein